MAHFTLPIDNNGPLLNVTISVSTARADALIRAGQPVPNAISVRGLVDTGASCTAIDTLVINGLSLEPTGELAILSPTTGAEPDICEQYDVGVSIYARLEDPPLRIPILPVIQAPLSNQGIQALIGRDVLDQCVLIYNGAMKQYTLSF